MVYERTMVTSYALAHFLVDFACAFLMFRSLLMSGDRVTLLLLYNFCAFALQMPLGLLADRLDRNGAVAGFGCTLVALAFLPGGLSAFAAAILAGVGNACFHVGGGLDVLNTSSEQSGLLGIFVSPGAIGLWLGQAWGRGNSLPALLPPLVLLAVALSFFLFQRYACPNSRSGNAPLALPTGTHSLWMAGAGLLLVVVARSYVGMTLSFSWKGEWHWSALLVLALAGGKAAGGLLADRWGIRRISALSLTLAALCFLGCHVPLLGVLAVFFFNMTMPLSLWAMGRLLPGAKGFSFGLLTFGLFLGFLPVALQAPLLLAGPLSYALAGLLSLALLLPCLKRAVH